MAAKAISEEPIPPLDEIPGVPMPYDQRQLYGHEETEQTLLEGYRSERLHHAWIIGGLRGIGKATLAFRFARFVFAYPDRFGADCNQATSLTDFGGNSDMAERSILTHTNILYLSRPWDSGAKKYKSEITVDEIRRTIPFFGSTAGTAGWRVCIVDSADEMNLNAANALLKILEEPPEKCVFLLLSHASGRLLPTIRSRCRKMELSPLNREELKLSLENLDLVGDQPQGQVDFAIEMAEGSVRRAAKLLVSDGIEFASILTGLFDGIASVSSKDLLMFADKVSRQNSTESFELFKEMTRNRIADMVREGVKKGVSNRRLAFLTELWEKTNLDASLAEELNLDKKQAVLDVFRNMREAIQKSRI